MSAVLANKIGVETAGATSWLEHEMPMPEPLEFQSPCLGDRWSLCRPGSLSDHSKQIHVRLAACVRSFIYLFIV